MTKNTERSGWDDRKSTGDGDEGELSVGREFLVGVVRVQNGETAMFDSSAFMDFVCLPLRLAFSDPPHQIWVRSTIFGQKGGHHMTGRAMGAHKQTFFVPQHPHLPLTPDRGGGDVGCL